MGKGARPGNEFTVKERRRQARPDQEYTSVLPELRVARRVTRDQGGLTDDWHEFQDNIGERNYGIGTAKALGSMAVVMVPAKAMGRMLEARYPEAVGTRDGAVQLHRKIAEGISHFMRNTSNLVHEETATEQEMAYAVLQQALQFTSFSNELEPEHGSWLDDEPYEDGIPLAVMDQQPAVDLPSIQLPYVDGVFKVSGVELFGKDGYGLDLSANEQLYEERAGLLHHLRVTERLDTAPLVRDGWKPHATNFNFESHISAAPIDYDAPLPPIIELGPAKPIVTKGL